ncbi:hypothetical protein [uncultured Allomuricauda sp.]|uniref:hypothetical protein n=1 Tax=Flagellimonas sp. W118 TaxID=3410791 RepID=UPI002631EF3C|nr:hypothetical protein [uncultured Allomuricauda sp.]
MGKKILENGTAIKYRDRMHENGENRKEFNGQISDLKSHCKISELADECERLGWLLGKRKEKLKGWQLIIDSVTIVVGLSAAILLSLNNLKLITLNMPGFQVFPIICAFAIAAFALAKRYFKGKNDPDLIEAYASYIYHYMYQLRSVKDDLIISDTQKKAKLQYLKDSTNKNIGDIYTKWPSFKLPID